jgi:hypothetical protein
MTPADTDQEAFTAATKQLGDVGKLAAEFSKNHGYRMALCHPDKSPANLIDGSESMSPMKVVLLMLVQSLVWAAVMIFAGSTLSGTDYGKRISAYLFAGWFVSWLLPLVLMDYRKALRAECAFFRRVFNRLVG